MIPPCCDVSIIILLSYNPLSLFSQVNEKGQVIAKSSLLQEMETELVEEAGIIKCCICLEGYKNQPQKVAERWVNDTATVMLDLVAATNLIFVTGSEKTDHFVIM